MKCIAIATAVALALYGAPSWAFPESAEMHISGNVTAAAACSMDIGNPNIDLGDIDYATLSQSSFAHYNTYSRTLSVTCDTPTRFALGVFDNRSEMLNPAMASCGHCLALGWTAAQHPIGFYGLGFYYQPVVDGSARSLLFSNDLATWQAETNLYLTPQAKVPSSNGRKFVAAGSGSTVVDATTMSLQFHVEVYLESRDTMSITQPTAIDGNSTLEIIYL